MSNDKTQEFDEPRSFEERVFARFDSLDGRLGVVEIRITKLEERQYDTKPIWEKALAALLEVKTDVSGLKDHVSGLKDDVSGLKDDVSGLKGDVSGLKDDVSGLKSDVATLKSDVSDLKAVLADTNANVAKNTIDLASHTESIAGLQSNLVELRTEMQAGFISLRNEVEHQFRVLTRKFLVLNDNWLELKGDQIYLDRRLGELEERTKST